MPKRFRAPIGRTAVVRPDRMPDASRLALTGWCADASPENFSSQNPCTQQFDHKKGPLPNVDAHWLVRRHIAESFSLKELPQASVSAIRKIQMQTRQ